MCLNSMKNNLKDISLYIHIPFCVRKCLYCDFLSFPMSEEKKESYVDILLKEFEMWERTLSHHREIFKTVFIGGGTPTCLKPELLRTIGERIKRHISSETEFTIEVNPGTLTDEHIEVFKDIGVNRISLGLQSAQNTELQRLGRIHSYEDFENNYKKLRAAGFTNINVDIMSDIPGQSPQSYRDTLQKVLELEPEHISAYSLIIEPGTPFFDMYENGELDIADEDTDRDMYAMTKSLLAKKGYNRYEISNYSKKGRECIHNIVYWNGGDYLGIGLGASSYVDGMRFAAPADFDEYEKFVRENYLKKSKELTEIASNLEESEVLTEDKKIEEFMFLGLRLTEGIYINVFRERFGKDIFEVYPDAIRKHIEEGLLVHDREKGRIYFSDIGLDLSNYVLSDFIID